MKHIENSVMRLTTPLHRTDLFSFFSFLQKKKEKKVIITINIEHISSTAVNDRSLQN